MKSREKTSAGGDCLRSNMRFSMHENKRRMLARLPNPARRLLRESVVVAGAYELFCILWLLLHPGPPLISGLVMTLLLPVGGVLALCIGLRGRPSVPQGATHSGLRFAQRWGTLCFVLGVGCSSLGTLSSFYLIVVLRQWPMPQPSIADAFYLVSYPFSWGFFLCMPTRPLGKGLIRVRFLLQSLLIVVSLGLGAWYFLLGPLFLTPAGMSAGGIINALYLLGALINICLLVYLFSRLSIPQVRVSLLLCAIALLLVSLVNILGVLMVIWHSLVLQPLDLVLLSSCHLAYGLATQRLRLAKHHKGAQEPAMSGQVHADLRPLLSPSLLPLLSFLLLPLVLALLLLVWSSGKQGGLEWGVYSGGALVIVLLFMRQMLTHQEMRSYASTTAVLNQDLQEANRRLATLATTDVLTNLPNHRALSEGLEQEGERARRYGHPLSLLFFDGDRFKQVNDTYGHATGDAVLRELGSRAASVVRAGDTLGRYGGEEFLLLLPETDAQAALIVAERLRIAVALAPLAQAEVAGGIAITVSIGVASYPEDGATASEVRDQADQAMYWAKRLGRNQVCTGEQARVANQDATLKATTAHLLER